MHINKTYSPLGIGSEKFCMVLGINFVSLQLLNGARESRLVKFCRKFKDLSYGHILFDISSLLTKAVAQNVKCPEFNFPMVNTLPSHTAKAASGKSWSLPLP